jgi:hypothetical protein
MKVLRSAVLAAIVSNGAACEGGWDPWKGWEKPGPVETNPTKECCSDGKTPWSCAWSIVLPPSMGDTFPCGRGLCAATEADAITAADKEIPPGAMVTGPPTCIPTWCGAQGPVKQQDAATCDSIVPGTCIAGTDACSVCLNSCCAEYAACVALEGDAICAAVIGYWQGTGPAPEGVSSSAINELNGCATSECGATTACTAYLVHLDGGL